jgi:replicative DNA helicase
MVTGLPTGLDRYDRLTLGLHAKQLTIVGARPGMGKTSLGGTIAANVAAQGVGVLFFSLEMSREEIIQRALSARAEIDGTLLKLGRLTQTQWDRLHAAAIHIRDLPLWIDDRTGLTVHDIADRALGAMDESLGSQCWQSRPLSIPLQARCKAYRPPAEDGSGHAIPDGYR